MPPVSSFLARFTYLLALVSIQQSSRFLIPMGVIRSAVQMAVGLSVSDLRSSRPRSDEEDLMTFVHTYDPAYPGLLNDIKSRISRLFMSKEFRPILGASG